jgi:peptidoglycan hydrolase-like protein with peptidoglycan-binding domain
MKNKVIMIAFAAAVSLAGCTSDNEHTNSATGNDQSQVVVDNNQTAYGSGAKTLNRADIRKVQRSLTAEGFYNGKIDGVWGKQTSQAILAYQNAHQQAQTGAVTVETLQQFGVRMNEQRQKSED